MKREDYLDREPIDWQQRAVRWASAVTIAACLFILIWVR